MNENPENIALIHELDLLFSRWMLFRACMNARSDGNQQYNLDQLFILEYLQLGPGLTLTGLHKLIGKAIPSVAGWLKELETDGLVIIRREESQRDAPIFLTEAGTERLAQIRSEHAGLTSHTMIGGGFSHGLTRLNEEETVQLRAAAGLILERQKRVMEANMFRPAPIACFHLA